MTHLSAWVMLAGLSLALGPALADEDEFEALEHEVMRLAAGRAKITLKQAIEAGAKEAGTGKLIGVELSLENETPVFELDYLIDAGELEVSVDAITGKLLSKQEEKPDAEEAVEHKQAGAVLNAAKLTLAQVVDTALADMKGAAAVEAGAEVEDGQLEFKVELLAGDVFKTAEIGPDGKVRGVKEKKAEGQAWIFDRDAAGKTPLGWKFGFTHPESAKAAWTVEKDAAAPSGPNLLALKAESGDSVFNLGMATGTSYQDVNVRTRIRANSGKEDQGGGVIWRCKDEDNYYICRINPLESNFRVYKVAGGKRQQLASTELKTEAGKWYVVRAAMIGDKIACYVDGKKLLEAKDGELKDAGMVGLWTKADASSSFDNVAVQPARADDDDEDDEDDDEKD